MYGEPARGTIFRPDPAAHRLDIAARDPQSDPKIAGGAFACRLGAPLGIISVKDAVELSFRHPRALVAHRKMSKGAAARQMDQDLAARRRKRDGVVEQVFEDGLDH